MPNLNTRRKLHRFRAAQRKELAAQKKAQSALVADWEKSGAKIDRVLVRDA